MKQFLTYQSLLIGIVYLLLFSQFLASTVSYYQIGDSTELIEIFDIEDNESEEEVDEKELDDKIRTNSFASQAYNSTLKVNISYLKNSISIACQKIIIPPPEFFSLI